MMIDYTNVYYFNGTNWQFAGNYWDQVRFASGAAHAGGFLNLRAPSTRWGETRFAQAQHGDLSNYSIALYEGEDWVRWSIPPPTAPLERYSEADQPNVGWAVPYTWGGFYGNEPNLFYLYDYPWEQ